MDGNLALLTQKWDEFQAFLGKMLEQTYVCAEEAPGFAHQPPGRERDSSSLPLKSALSWRAMVHCGAGQGHGDGKEQSLVKKCGASVLYCCGTHRSTS